MRQVLLVLWFSCLNLSPAFAGNPRGCEHSDFHREVSDVPDKVFKAWVFFRDKGPGAFMSGDTADLPLAQEYRSAVVRFGVLIRSESRWFNALSVEATGEALEEISRLPFVDCVDRVRGGRRRVSPEDKVEPLRPQQFSMLPREGEGIDYGPSIDQLEQIGVIELHDSGYTGEGVTVALLDVGFDHRHPVFARAVLEKRLLAQRDFVMGDYDVRRDREDPNDYDDEHGTQTWSVLGGWAPGNLIGPAYGASFLLAKTEDARSETPDEEDFWIAGLEWAEGHGARIVSSSLGYRDFDDPAHSYEYAALDGGSLMISRAASMAAQRGVLIVNSMGNEGPDEGSLVAPADSDSVLSVGAVTKRGEPASFSSRGPNAAGLTKPDVVARGVWNVLATAEGFGRGSGTSFSAPLVAGVAALLIEAHPDWTVEQTREALKMTADRASAPDNSLGWGLVNAPRALAYMPSGGTALAAAGP